MTPTPISHELHGRLLAAWFTPDLSFTAIAARVGIGFYDVILWSEDPQTRADIHRITEASRRRAADLAAMNLPAAVEQLTRTAHSAAALRPEPAAGPAVMVRLADTARKTAAALARIDHAAAASQQVPPLVAPAPAPQPSPRPEPLSEPQPEPQPETQPEPEPECESESQPGHETPAAPGSARAPASAPSTHAPAAHDSPDQSRTSDPAAHTAPSPRARSPDESLAPALAA